MPAPQSNDQVQKSLARVAKSTIKARHQGPRVDQSDPLQVLVDKNKVEMSNSESGGSPDLTNGRPPTPDYCKPFPCIVTGCLDTFYSSSDRAKHMVGIHMAKTTVQDNNGNQRASYTDLARSDWPAASAQGAQFNRTPSAVCPSAARLPAACLPAAAATVPGAL